MPIVNLGILARVDAVESPFFATGDTQLISLSNTPGHANEGAWSLGVPDGAQPSARSRAEAVRAIHLPVLIVIHQINRPGLGAVPRSFPCNHFGL